MPSAPEGQSGFLYLGVWIFVSHYSGNLEKHHHSWGGLTRVNLEFKLLYLTWGENWKSSFL